MPGKGQQMAQAGLRPEALHLEIFHVADFEQEGEVSYG
jgi:hypothetical protein